MLKIRASLISLFLLGCTPKDQIKESQKLSYNICYSYTQGKCSSGTGFYLSYKEKTYLVSALHVFSGVNPNTNQPIIQNYPLPSQIRTSNLENGDPHFEYWPLKDAYGNIKYIKPDTTSIFYDLALLEVDLETQKNVLDWNDNWLTYSPKINEQVFYFGYPVINDNIPKIPRLFRGKITSLPSKDTSLITTDMNSFQGCSGSPVFTLQGNNIVLIGIVMGTFDDDNKNALIVPLPLVWGKIQVRK